MNDKWTKKKRKKFSAVQHLLMYGVPDSFEIKSVILKVSFLSMKYRTEYNLMQKLKSFINKLKTKNS